MVMVDAAEDPGLTEPTGGLKAIVKSAAGPAVMVTTTVCRWQTLAIEMPVSVSIQSDPTFCIRE
jgi:hypothetical protein